METEMLEDTQSRGTISSLGENEYLVHVDYDALCGKEAKDSLSEMFCVDYDIEWQPHPSCAEIDQTHGSPKATVMLLRRFEQRTKFEAGIIEMEKLGYRPATCLEAYAFVKAYAELQRELWIIALGSSTVHGVGSCVALFYDGRHAYRIIESEWFADGFLVDYRFLFVRK